VLLSLLSSLSNSIFLLAGSIFHSLHVGTVFPFQADNLIDFGPAASTHPPSKNWLKN
jgi:hypothetical protein